MLLFVDVPVGIVVPPLHDGQRHTGFCHVLAVLRPLVSVRLVVRMSQLLWDGALLQQGVAGQALAASF